VAKQLITVLGIAICAGIIALGLFVVALPTALQAQSVDSQTDLVADSNSAFEAQVDRLEQEAERQEEIDASVAALRRQIPATNQFDDVFEVVATAAVAANVSITSAVVGEVGSFAPRTADAAAQDAGTGGVADDAANGAGRAQATFTIGVSAPGMDSATAFLDELRKGPRLLSIVKTTATGSGVVDLQIDALTYVDSEE